MTRRSPFTLILSILTVLAVIGFPLLLSSMVDDEEPAAASASGMTLGSDFRTRFVRYAVIQRPDATIRYLYINPEALENLGVSDVLPDGTMIVIEGFYALKDETGAPILDAEGRYQIGEPFPALHVREKRRDWSDTDFVSDLRNGAWNYGSFDRLTGEPFAESLNACFNCHQVAPQDFLYTAPLLASYRRSGDLQVYLCEQTGRTPCD